MAKAEIVPIAGILPVDKALRETEIIVSLGIILGSLESLWAPKVLEEGGLLGWRVNKSRFPRLTRSRVGKVVDLVFTSPGIHVLTSMQLAAATLVALPGTDRKLKAAATAFLTVANGSQSMRSHLGKDGADQANFIVLAALTASRFFPHDAAARKACTAFIAGQSVVSYFAAGAAKAFGPYWRDGSAMQGIFRTRTYGTKWVAELLAKYPLLAKVSGWGVWIGEMLFPLVLVARKPVAAGLMATGVSFHAGNAAFMGLNRFLWAFSATYPSVRHHSRHLSKR